MHILNGDSAAASFKQAFDTPEDEILIFRDVLSCGALGDYLAMAQWAKARGAYWADMYAEHGFGSTDEIEQAPRGFYNEFTTFKNSQEVTLWIGRALSDHLLLVFIVKLFDFYGLDFKKLSICQYLSLDQESSGVIGLGRLTPLQIKALKPEPFILNSEQVTECLNVWEAVTASTPEALVNILKPQKTSLPLLHESLKTLFYRFPDYINGLSYFDNIILAAVKNYGPGATGIIGHVLAYDIHCENKHKTYFLDAVGDIYLFARLKNMAKNSLKKPLLSLNVKGQLLKQTQVEITEFGLGVLEGRYNAVQVNGIDDWVGGIYLNDRLGNLWFRKDNELVFLHSI